MMNCRHGMLLSLLCLAACAGQDPSPQQTLEAQQVRITPVVLTLTFEGLCSENSYQLEQWLGMSMTARQNLSRLMDSILDERRELAGGQIELLVGMRNGMAALPTPDCAAEAHRLFIQAVDLGLDIAQSYIGGELEALEAKREELTRLLSILDEQYTDLGELLQALVETSPAP